MQNKTMRVKKSFIYTSFSLLTAAFFLFFFLIPILFINTAAKKPAHGWQAPELNTGGSRTEYLHVIAEEEKWLSEKHPEEITITSFDGLKLNAQFLSAPDSDGGRTANGTIIMMHGYHSRADFEFAGFYSFFHNEGYNILLCDQRTHGKSGGKYLTFGIKERFDCRDWISYTDQRFSGRMPIWLCGVSMGSSTVLMTLGFDLPESVRGVIADCGFTTPSAIVAKVLKSDYNLPPLLMMAQIKFWTKIICSFDLDGYSTLTALKTTRIPVFFIHGTNDSFVPFEMSIQNYQECNSEKYFMRTSAKHAANFLSETDKYKRNINLFLQKTK